MALVNMKEILTRVLSFFRLVRWANLLIMVFIQFALYYVLVDRFYGMVGVTPALGYTFLSLLVVVTVLVSAAGYIINDYFDIRVDRINKPGKMVIEKHINYRAALTMAWILNAVAVVLGFYLARESGSWRLGLLFPMVIMMLWLYSINYKRTVLWGNIAVALLSAMVVLFVWLFEFFMLRQQPASFVTISAYLGVISAYFGFYALFAFFITLIREVVKDAEDIEGDKTYGVNTLAVRYGTGMSKKVAAGIAVFTVLAMVYAVWVMFKMNMVIPFIYYFVAVIIPLVYVVFRIRSAQSKADFSAISSILKLIMLAGIIGLQPIAMTLSL